MRRASPTRRFAARLYLLESAEGDGAVGVNPPRARSRLDWRSSGGGGAAAAALVDGAPSPRRARRSCPRRDCRRGTRRAPSPRTWRTRGDPASSTPRREPSSRRVWGADAEDADARAREDSDETPPREPFRAARSESRWRRFLAALRPRPRSPRRSSAVRSSFISWTMRTGRTRALAKPLNPSAKRRDDRGANGRTPSRVGRRRRALRLRLRRGARAPLRRPRRARREVPRAHRERTFRPETDIMEKDITLRRSVASACASAARAGRGRRFRRGGRGGRGGLWRTEPLTRKVSRLSRRLVRGGGARAGLGFGGARRARRRRGGGGRRRRGPGAAPRLRACAARAADDCRGGLRVYRRRRSRRRERAPPRVPKKTKIVTPLLLLTAVRTLLESSVLTASVTGESVTRESVTRERAENASRPFAFAFASLAASADAATAAMAKRALFGDAFETLEFGNDDAIAALAAASVFECAVSRNDTDRQKTEDGVPVALRARSPRSSRTPPRRAAAAPRETAAFAALREAISGMVFRNRSFAVLRDVPACARPGVRVGDAAARASVRRAEPVACGAPRGRRRRRRGTQVLGGGDERAGSRKRRRRRRRRAAEGDRRRSCPWRSRRSPRRESW